MLKLNCPTCGAELIFRSAGLLYRICDYCRTLVVRRLDGVEAIGSSAVLPFDVSPLRIGTSGRFGEQEFELVGRVRWGWTDGSWNEWLCLFTDGSAAWLGEAMGQYMLLRERDLDSVPSREIRALREGAAPRIGERMILDGETMFVADAREASCLAAEGELPFAVPTGATIFSIDFRSESGRCASLQRDEREAAFYDGRYVTLAELSPRDMRALEGWPLPVFAP